MLEGVRIVGHRGASAYAPENTFASFEKAKNLGCRFIEFDVMLSADGEPFIIHDDSLKRTTNGQGDVGLVTADYLSSLDAGRWFSKRFLGEKIPTFSHVLQWLDKNGIQANIEIKPYPKTTEQTTVAVLTAINQFWPMSARLPLVSSFDQHVLTLCRELSPEMPLGLLYDTWDEKSLMVAKNLNCYSMHFNYRALTKARIDTIKASGFKLLAYTVNKKALARRLLDWGVDAVFSDYPDLLS